MCVCSNQRGEKLIGVQGGLIMQKIVTVLMIAVFGFLASSATAEENDMEMVTGQIAQTKFTNMTKEQHRASLQQRTQMTESQRQAMREQRYNMTGPQRQSCQDRRTNLMRERREISNGYRTAQQNSIKQKQRGGSSGGHGGHIGR